MYDGLDGATAVVTGAAQGIGLGIAERLGEAGANVVVADVDEAGAESAVEDLRADGIGAAAVACDVSDPGDARALDGFARDAFGPADVLVNNAGIGGYGSFLDLTDEEWRAVIDVNLTGAFNCSKALAPGMVEAGGGRIVNVSSMAGRNISYHGAANYTASKWGLVGLTKHAAWDLGPDGVTVNAVCPGTTRTPLNEAGATDAERERTLAKIPLGRFARPRDQAEAVAFLASEAGGYLTGTVLEVDGGKQLGVRKEI